MIPFSLMPFILLVVSVSSQTEPELLKGTSCEKVYKEALGNRTSLNFSAPIGNITCQKRNKDLKYQCFVDEHQRELQWCNEWHWIEPGLCPKYYILTRKLNPVPCEIEGCPKVQYMSHEYYKYPVCFSLSLAGSISGTSEKQEKGSNRSNNNSSNVKVVLAVVLPICVAAIVIAVIVCVVLKRRKRGTKHPKDDVELKLLDEFRQERPFEAMVKCIEQKSHIVLTGLPGSGVSTLLDQMRKLHQEKKWHTEQHGQLHVKRRGAQFVLFDQSGLQKLMAKHAAEQISNEMTQVLGETTVIFNVEYDWYTKCAETLPQFIGKTYNIVDLSSEEYRLTTPEKIGYLNDLCDKYDITEDELPEEKRHIIASYEESNKGFPLLCLDLINHRKFDDPEAYLRMKDSKKDEFRQERPFEAMVKCIEQRSHIVLTGLPGSGVSTLLDQMRKLHQEKKWHKEQHGQLHVKRRGAQFVLFDQSGLQKLMAKHAAEQISNEMTQVLGETTVIFNVEYDWYTKCAETLPQFIGKTYNIVDLSSEEYRLTTPEKIEYLNYLCDEYEITEDELPEEKRHIIASYEESNKGFPLLCLDLINNRKFDDPEAYLRMTDSKKA